MCADITKRKKRHRRICLPPTVKRYKKIDMARTYLSRKQYLFCLSRPNFRFLQDIEWRRCKKKHPNWQSCSPMFPISQAALRAKAGKRTQFLAAPHVPHHELQRRKYLHDEMLLKKEVRTAQQEKLPEHYVKPPALKATATSRVTFLSYPKMIYAESQVKEFGPLLGKQFEQKMIEFIKKSQMYTDKEKSKDKKYETFHIRSHKSMESIVSVSTICKLPKKKFKPMTQEEYTEWLDKIAAAKVVHKPPPPPKKKRVKLAVLKPRLDKLAKPLKVYEKVDEAIFFTVKRPALRYHITERVRQIAEPRFQEEVEQIELTKYGVVPKALRAIATPATIKLAKPVERKSKVTEEYEFAFKVKPEALKARCSKRTKQLAQPIDRS